LHYILSDVIHDNAFSAALDQARSKSCPEEITTGRENAAVALEYMSLTVNLDISSGLVVHQPFQVILKQ
jgi:hypothetical protein